MLLYAGALPDLYAINIVRIGSATESVHGGGVVFREACGNKRFIRCVLPPGIPGGDNDNAEHTTGSDFQDQLHLKGSPWRAGGRGHVCTTSLIPVLVQVSLISRRGAPGAGGYVDARGLRVFCRGAIGAFGDLIFCLSRYRGRRESSVLPRSRGVFDKLGGREAWRRRNLPAVPPSPFLAWHSPRCFTVGEKTT